MNFAREKCDERAMQSLMRNNVFPLHVGKESCCRCVADWGWHSGNTDQFNGRADFDFDETRQRCIVGIILMVTILLVIASRDSDHDRVAPSSTLAAIRI
jgi:hypothetical protein